MKRHLILGMAAGAIITGLAAPTVHASTSPTAAAALPLVQRTSELPTQYGTAPSRTRVAFCPAGTWVVGGGAQILGGQGRVALTALESIFSRSGSNYYFARASGLDSTFSGSWTLQPYAICAALSDPGQFDLVFRSSSLSSATFQHAEAVCPAGKRAISAGAQIATVGTQSGAVALQLVRTSDPRDIARATAREAAGGNSGTWFIQSQVMCGPAGLVGTNAPSGTLSGSADAAVSCPAGKRAHGAGGGGSITDSGVTFLDGVVPSPGLSNVSSSMTTAPAAGMVVQAVCL